MMMNKSKFIQLTFLSGTKVYFNADVITQLQESTSGTYLFVLDSDEGMTVQESVDEILAKIEEAESKEQEQIKEIVTHYGANDRARLLMEECGELVQAANKILRYPDSHEARVNLLEEMVDVSIMIEQIRTLFNYDELEWNHMMQYKINRCNKRFIEDVSFIKDVSAVTDDAERRE